MLKLRCPLQVIDGKSERGDHPVVRMPMKQWVLRITAYADRLLKDLDELDWSESIKDMQRNWIGRSEVGCACKWSCWCLKNQEISYFFSLTSSRCTLCLRDESLHWSSLVACMVSSFLTHLLGCRHHH